MTNLLPETNNSAPLKLTHMLILNPSMLAFTFLHSLETLDWLSKASTELSDDTRDITLGLMQTPSLWKHNKLLMVLWSTYLQSFDLLGPFFLDGCSFHNSSVFNTGKTKYIEIGRHRGMVASEHIRIGSNFYEKVKTFKYIGSLVTNQNSVQEEIKCRLKAGNSCSCYYSVQTFLCSQFLSKNLKIKII